MTRQLILEQNVQYLTAYTRNPSLLKMIANVMDQVFPIDNAVSLRQMALTLDGTQEVAGDYAVYHLGRYGVDGLYGRVDPAKKDDAYFGNRLIDVFPILQDRSNALAVVACKGRSL